MKKSQTGFTLIELMIVVAIIGILASLAISAYQTYTIRAQISEGLNLVGPAKNGVASFNIDSGLFPADNADAGLEPPGAYAGNYVTSIAVAGPVITILYGNRANAQIAGESITLTATRTQGSINWTCASGGVIRSAHLPAVCR